MAFSLLTTGLASWAIICRPYGTFAHWRLFLEQQDHHFVLLVREHGGRLFGVFVLLVKGSDGLGVSLKRFLGSPFFGKQIALELERADAVRLPGETLIKDRHRPRVVSHQDSLRRQSLSQQ